ncbi:hypothetical protein [uncultured Planktosalinus sp.]|uniref:hypothetical protein n=1 Tax=uncultured Planktosalinus sp. TaxID=1810935 RepID=UPI0030D8F778
MKKGVLIMVLATIIMACSSIKRSEKALNKGAYEQAIEIAVKKIQKNKTSNKSRELIPVLEEAFAKYNEQTLNKIQFLEKESNLNSKKEILALYTRLNQTQNKIKPLLPLVVNSREASFEMNDYSNQLIQAKDEYADVLYEKAKKAMSKGTKVDYRKAYNSLVELEKLVPYYKDVDQLIRETHYFGTDYVFVELKNATNIMIPQRLERDLLDINTYRLDDFWTEYHSINRRDIDYDFDVILEFRNILISPEQIREREIPLEREIKDGYTYEIDRNGNYVLDSLGNRKKIDRYVNVKGILYETTQTKAINVNGMVNYFDVQKKQTINSYPMETEFIFEHAFATFNGDERVLNSNERRLLKNRPLPFPSNEQMLYDASSEIKNRLSTILKRNKFR